MIVTLLTLLTSIITCYIVVFTSIYLFLKQIYLKNREEIYHDGNQAIVITGCDSGIGFELAKYFYETTKFKIICGFLRPSCSDGYKLLGELEDQNRLILKRLNLKSTDDIEDIVKTCQSIKLHALINNAGVMTYGEFDWMTWDQIYSQVDVNIVGTLRLTRALLPFIIENKGRIINVSSVNDKTVFPGLSIYSATKSALSTFSRGLGYEMRKFGAKVVTVRLGDFARLTNIMSQHASNRDEMWNEMGTQKQDLYRGFFQEFNDHLLQNYGMTSPKKFGESTLFLDFRMAVLAMNPPLIITCAPITFRIFYFVIERIPVWLQYNLLDLLFRFAFDWKPSNRVTTCSAFNE